MQRNGERKLLGDVGKLTDTGNNTASRDGKVARTDTDAVGIVENTQGLENLVIVCEGFALTHEDDARGTLAKIVGDMQDLVDDFLGS